MLRVNRETRAEARCTMANKSGGDDCAKCVGDANVSEAACAVDVEVGVDRTVFAADDWNRELLCAVRLSGHGDNLLRAVVQFVPRSWLASAAASLIGSEKFRKFHPDAKALLF